MQILNSNNCHFKFIICVFVYRFTSVYLIGCEIRQDNLLSVKHLDLILGSKKLFVYVKEK